jgi:hypothetical protein
MPSFLFIPYSSRVIVLAMKTVLFLLAMLLSSVSFSQTEGVLPDKFKIAMGGFALVRFDSAISLTDPDFGAGVSIDPQDALGMTTQQTVLRLGGYYRFSRHHALTYSWYSISLPGYKTLDHEIDWIDKDGNPVVIPVGAKVSTSLDYDIYKIGYLWSFHHTDKVEMSAGIGLHTTNIAISLKTDVTGTVGKTKDKTTTVPLPVLSFNIKYRITPKFNWYLETELFAIEYSDINGVFTDISLGVEYRVFRHVGLGMGLDSNSLKVVEDESDYQFTYDNRLTGLLLYAAAYF